MYKLKEIIEHLSPIIISPTTSSLTLSISKRFFLFRMMNRIINVIEDDPHLNFVALLKSYKVLGKILHGSIHEFYRDRNKLYFKNFFYDRELYQIVKSDLEHLYPKYKNINLTITKRGVLIYHNYHNNSFNTLLLTIHAGSWFPTHLKNKLKIAQSKRKKEEDLDTHKIYSKLVLDKGGIWIDNKQSRFLIDFNRDLDRAIYTDGSQVFDAQAAWKGDVWKTQITNKEKKEVEKSYHEFYFTLARLIDSHKFNIIFDGHSMNDRNNRPNISFGTDYIPTFYMPIVKSMQRKMSSLGYSPVLLNTPYGGGHIVEWLKEKFPNTFLFSMEINKKLYTNKTGLKSNETKLKKLSKDIQNIFDIEVDYESS